METSEESDHVGSSEQSRGRKRTQSVVWEHLSQYFGDDGNKRYARCNHCQKGLSTKSHNGTTHLMKHLTTSCPNYKLVPGSGIKIGPTGSPKTIYQFDQVKCRKRVARICIRHKYPFSIGNHEEVKSWARELNPEYEHPSRNTIRADVIAFHKEERVKIYNMFDGLHCKVSLTTDIWTSEHNHTPYICLTCHFIDDNWELCHKVLSFKQLPYPHDGNASYIVLRTLIVEWNFDKKLSCIVVDNASANDSMIKKLKEWLVGDSLVPLMGDLLHVRCSAHILNLIVQDGLSRIKGSIENIRQTVRYLLHSPLGKQKFDQVKSHLKLYVREVAMDVPNRWNATFEMIKTALPLKEAFSRLEIIDPNYRFNPSDRDWRVMKDVFKILEVFYKATIHFSGRKFPTSNVFFPDICDINMKLAEWKESEIEIIKEMSIPMKEKFGKYWDECNLVLAVAVIFDPRRKMQFVEYIYTKLYGLDAGPYIEKVRTALNGLFTSYGGSLNPSSNEKILVLVVLC